MNCVNITVEELKKKLSSNVLTLDEIDAMIEMLNEEHEKLTTQVNLLNNNRHEIIKKLMPIYEHYKKKINEAS